jgi:hypothetical protein
MREIQLMEIDDCRELRIIPELMKRVFLIVCGLGLILGQGVVWGAAETTIGIEAEDFQFTGQWATGFQPPGHSGKSLLSNGQQGAKLPAVTGINIPKAGKYALWVRAVDYADQAPRTRTFTVSVGGKKSAEVFGDSGKSGYTWEPGGVFDLSAGSVLLGIHDVGRPFARCDAILLSSDLKFVPTLPLGKDKHPRMKPVQRPLPPDADPFKKIPVKDLDGAPVARLENEFLRLEFTKAERAGMASVRPRVAIKSGSGWRELNYQPEAEIYSIVAAQNVTLQYSSVFPLWNGGTTRTLTVEAGGAKWQTALPSASAIWCAGDLLQCVPKTAVQNGNKVQLTFHPSAAGEFSAAWELRPGERAARVMLNLKAAQAGDFCLGYHLFTRKPVAEVDELLLPMMWHRKRFPDQPRTLLQPFTPTPVALFQADGVVCGVTAEPADIPFAWPDRSKPQFGLMIRDVPGNVHPSIHGPIPGTAAAKAKAGDQLKLALRVFAIPGDWYAGYRLAADDIFAWKDYRSNVGVSLTDAALNMMDLIMDDNLGGWWKRGKGPYQIETLNGVTHSSPLMLVSMYWLTGEQEVYRRRVLPTLEFMLSRNGVHFSPEPDNTGIMYSAGSMDGPGKIFGSTVYGGLWEMTQRRTPAFRQIALPETGVKTTGGYGHTMEFEDWLARYRLTGEATALTRARELADKYLTEQVIKAPTAEINPQPFFNVSFVPNWEGLLRMYEATKDKKYLEGAMLGARQLMTSVWTQPPIPAGNCTVHPGGEYTASSPKHIWWKGPDTFRLGYPRKKGDAPEHQVPAWVPSNVGLGFEQPVTYSRADSGGAMIYQSAWAPNFLRLAQYSGDSMFETYARNTTLGRFANYPGYYVVGFTDLPLNPQYPMTGPDVSCVYYHHIPVHLAWTVDYLVTEAGLRSQGQITFPAQHQNGYVWFDNRIYGHAPGSIFGDKNVWLWLRKGLVTLDNPALNYLTAESGDKFFLVLMNENNREEKLTVKFAVEKLGFAVSAPPTATVLTGKTAQPISLTGANASLAVPARGLVVLRLEGGEN